MVFFATGKAEKAPDAKKAPKTQEEEKVHMCRSCYHQKLFLMIMIFFAHRQGCGSQGQEGAQKGTRGGGGSREIHYFLIIMIVILLDAAPKAKKAPKKAQEDEEEEAAMSEDSDEEHEESEGEDEESDFNPDE